MNILNNLQYRLMNHILGITLKHYSKRNRGQAMSEYLIFTLGVSFPLLFVKFGMPGADDVRRNTVEWLFWGLNQYVLGILYVIALPLG